ncbi:hypothetical protein FA13DRAFT_216969 [Coprinellus micaceus]|uniref:Uncharacterized protein n=1 Tax=Coprinellus micaceus TaxID=71717 RepID=A0A4Y7TEN2_COPMI|nr:hypothetical protein FA13DRAFT_216969 [Coprinellus micaceus]
MAAATATTRRLASTLTTQASQQIRAPPPIPSTPAPKPRNPHQGTHSSLPYFNPADDDAMILYRPVFTMNPASPVRLHTGEPRIFLKKSVKLDTTLEWQQQAGERIRDPPPARRLSMPSPLIFDGPAQPRHERIHDSYHQLRNTVYTAPSPVSTSVGRPHLPPSGKAPMPTPPPAAYREMHGQSALKVFDGPAKVARYQHRSQKDNEAHQRPSPYIHRPGYWQQRCSRCRVPSSRNLKR